MSGTGPSPEVVEALEELQQYLSDALSPLIVADSVQLLLQQPPELVANKIHAWTATQYRTTADIPVSDYLFHAVKKLQIMGEFRLVPREPLERFLHELQERVLEFCPEADREFLRANFSRLGESSGATMPTAEVIFRQMAGERPLAGKKLSSAGRPAASAEELVNLRRFSLLLDRLEREVGGQKGLPAKTAPLATQALTAAARGSQSSEELEQYLDRLRAIGLDVGTADLFRSLGHSLPGWVLPGAEKPGAPPPGGSQTVEAMHRIVTQAENPAEGARRFHEMVKAAIERFNDGSLAQAVTMLELAERIIAERQVDPVSADVVRKKADESLDLERLRKYAEVPEQHALLRQVLSFFTALTPESLLADLKRELKRDRRRLLLLLLEVHGPAAREAALERVRPAVARGAEQEEWYFRRNLLYLLRRIPRPAGVSEDEDVDIAVRHVDLNLPSLLVKEAIANLGQLKQEKSERTLVALLADLETMLAKPSEAPYDAHEMRLVLDRVVAALARFGTPGARRAVVEHGLKKRAELGETTARLAELARQDLSGDPELVDRLLSALKANSPFRLFGLVLQQNDQNLSHCVEALSGTPTPAVRQAFEEVIKRFPGQESAKAAAKALAGFTAPAPSSTSREGPASLSGDLELFGLPALMQSFAESRVSGLLTLRDPKGEVFGTLSLRGGKLKTCATGRLAGEEAFYQLLERPVPGNFQFNRQAESSGEDPSGLREILPLSLEGMRRYDEFQQAAALVPDDVVLKATDVRPTAHANEKDGILMKDLWTVASRGSTPRQCEGEVRADSYRIRRLLAHWVESGALVAGQ